MMLLCTGLFLLATPTLAQLPSRFRSHPPSRSLPNKQDVSERGKKGQKQLTKAELANDTLVIGQDTLRLALGQLLTNSGQAVRGYQDPEVHDVATYRHVLLSVPKSRTFYIVHFRRTDAADMETEVAASYSKGHLDMDSSRPAVYEPLRPLDAANNGTLAVDGNTGSGWVVVREAGRLYSFRLLEGRRSKAMTTFPRLPNGNNSQYRSLRLTGNALLLELAIGTSVQQLGFGFWEGKLLPELPTGFELGAKANELVAAKAGKLTQAEDSLLNRGEDVKDSLLGYNQKLKSKVDSIRQMPAELGGIVQSKAARLKLRTPGKVVSLTDSLQASVGKRLGKQLRGVSGKVSAKQVQQGGIPKPVAANNTNSGDMQRVSPGAVDETDQGQANPGAQAASELSVVSSAKQRVFTLVKRGAKRDKRSNIWYFGHGTGLDLNGDTAVSLSDGKIAQLEGSASIADTNGQLLFYTDGKTVYNRAHEPVRNGTGLKGHTSASTAALIVPAPGSSHSYYVFTSDEGGYIKPKGNGVHYSVVDMVTTEGEVTIKNRLLLPNATERLAAVQHPDGESVWILTQPVPGNELHAYLLDKTGLAAAPVISKTLTMSTFGNGSIGVMKSSPDGKRLAITNTGAWHVEVHDFDAATGKLANGISLQSQAHQTLINNPYGLAFSPNSKKLYVGEWDSGIIHQFDVSGSANITRHFKYELETPDSKIGALQLTNTGQILFATVGPAYQRVQYLGAILLPNNDGATAVFLPKAIKLGSAKASLGLPNFPGFAIQPLEADMNVGDYCAASNVGFAASANSTVDHWLWSFGDGNEVQVPGTTLAVAHSYRETGSYTVRLVAVKGASQDTVWRTLTLGARPTVDAGPNLVLAKNATCTLEASGKADWWYWSTGETSQRISASRPGRYVVLAGNGGCIASDTVLVLPGEEQLALNDLKTLTDAQSPAIGAALTSKPAAVERALTWLIDHHTLTYNIPYNPKWSLLAFSGGNGQTVYQQYGSEQLAVPAATQALHLQRSSNALWLIGVRFSPN